MSVLERLMAPQITQSRERRVHGLVTAKVLALEGDGAYRLEYLSMGDAQPSAPARVMMPMAGDRRGVHFLPEPGDEVVVAFELGDTNLPVILGAVWNNQSRAPDQASPSPENNIRTIVSRSGHELTFDDTTGAEKVKLKSKSGHEITLDDAPLGRTITLKTAGGLSAVLDDKTGGSIKLSGPTGASVGMDATGGIAMSTPTTIELRASQIKLVTTGVTAASNVWVESLPFSAHLHWLAPGVPTGTVI